MADVQVTVSGPKSVNDSLQELYNLVVAIKAGQGLSTVLAGQVGNLIGLLPELSTVGVDVKTELGASIDLGSVWGRKIVFALLGLS
jgi:hypothetical protein